MLFSKLAREKTPFKRLLLFFAFVSFFILNISYLEAVPVQTAAKVMNEPPSIDFIGTYIPLYAKQTGKESFADEYDAFRKIHDSLNLKSKSLSALIPSDTFSPSRREVYIGAMVSDLNTCNDIIEVKYKIVRALHGKLMPYNRFGGSYRKMALLYCSNLTAFYFARYTMNSKDEYMLDRIRYPGSYRIIVMARDSDSYVISSTEREWADFHYGRTSFFGDFFSGGSRLPRTTSDYLLKRMAFLKPWRENSERPALPVSYTEENTEKKSSKEQKKTERKRPEKRYAQLGSGWITSIPLLVLLALLFLMKKHKKQVGGDTS